MFYGYQTLCVLLTGGNSKDDGGEVWGGAASIRFRDTENVLISLQNCSFEGNHIHGGVGHTSSGGKAFGGAVFIEPGKYVVLLLHGAC